MRSTGALLLAAGMVFLLSISGISRPASLAAEMKRLSRGGGATREDHGGGTFGHGREPIICPDVVTDYVFSQEKA